MALFPFPQLRELRPNCSCVSSGWRTLLPRISAAEKAAAPLMSPDAESRDICGGHQVATIPLSRLFARPPPPSAGTVWVVPLPSLRRTAVLTVINLKGGVGKTHATWLIAGVCEQRHQRVLLVDADMKASLTGSFVDEGNRELGIDALFDPAQDADAKSLVRHTDFPHIDFMPANTRLAQFDLADRRAWEKTEELHLSLVEPVAGPRSSYDYIVFDCPSRLSVVSFAICTAAGR